MDSARARFLVPGALLLLTWTLLALTRSAGLTADNLGYARAAVSGEGMFHPHHLLWIPAVRFVWSALGAAGLAGEGALAAQLVGIFCAGIAVAAVFLMADRLLGSRAAAVLTALALLTTRGFWLYATQAPVYLPAIALLGLLCLALAGRREDAGWWRRVWAPALCLGGAVLFHQSSVVIVVPLAVSLLAAEGRRGVVSALGIALPAGALALAAYAAAYAWTDAREIVTTLRGVRPVGLEGFLQFCQAYRYHPYPFWGTWDNVNAAGIARAVHSQVWDLIAFSPAAIPPAMKSAASAALALLAALLLADQSRTALRSPEHGALRLFLLAWLVTFWAFFLWLVPSTREYFVAPLVPLLLLAALSLRRIATHTTPRARTAVAATAGAAVCAAALVNLGATVWPAHRSRGSWYDEAMRLSRVAPAECVVGGDYMVHQHLVYYFGRRGVIDMSLSQLYHYRRLPLSPVLEVADTSCFVAPLSLVDPGYSVAGFDGYVRPAQWLRFVCWVLDVRCDPEGRLTSGRQFRRLANDVAPPLLHVLPERKPIVDVPSLMRELDRAAGVGGGTGPFLRWWRDAGVRLTRDDLRTIASHPVPCAARRCA